MPQTPLTPGTYVEEIPARARTITGVPTSLTAFLGRALRGPTDRPRRVQSFAEFERVFGGLWDASPLGHAVQQFFANGGREALVCRIHHGATAATMTLPGGLCFVAADEGRWGGRLRLRIDPADSLFDLEVTDTGTGAAERFTGLSTDGHHPKYIARVLQEGSALLRVDGVVPAACPPPWSAPFEDNGSDGDALVDADLSDPALEAQQRGLWLLEQADLFNLLCIPPLGPGRDVGRATWDAALAYALRRRAFVIVDPPAAWVTVAQVTESALDDCVSPGDARRNAAIYFPRIGAPDPSAPCGAVAGVYARGDAQRGVWKAPAGTDATLVGITQWTAPISYHEQDQLNRRGINALWTLPSYGPVIWGARSLACTDADDPEWRYVPVRRLALFIEESLVRGTRWAALERNDEPLWAQLRLSVGSFMLGLFQQGAFQGRSPHEAYFVKCGVETITRQDIVQGVATLLVGFAPLKPAEFIVLNIRVGTAP
jgi:hypothetical protein